MKTLINKKFKLMGAVSAFLLLFGMAYLAGSTSSSTHVANAQTAVNGSTTATSNGSQDQEKEGSDGETNDDNGAQNPNSENGNKDSNADPAVTAQVKITVEQAKTAALAQVPGTVTSAALEDENGQAVYAVVIQPSNGQAPQEVLVSATTGKIVAGDANNADNQTGQDNSDQGGNDQETND